MLDGVASHERRFLCCESFAVPARPRAVFSGTQGRKTKNPAPFGRGVQVLSTLGCVFFYTNPLPALINPVISTSTRMVVAIAGARRSKTRAASFEALAAWSEVVCGWLLRCVMGSRRACRFGACQ
ncbi:hypothetical protein LG3211_0877 [Lysobacter gummosus]|nr:hypothetical protein LG3211_0877 [Lysobacter gummosus]